MRALVRVRVHPPAWHGAEERLRTARVFFCWWCARKPPRGACPPCVAWCPGAARDASPPPPLNSAWIALRRSPPTARCSCRQGGPRCMADSSSATPSTACRTRWICSPTRPRRGRRRRGSLRGSVRRTAPCRRWSTPKAAQSAWPGWRELPRPRVAATLRCGGGAAARENPQSPLQPRAQSFGSQSHTLERRASQDRKDLRPVPVDLTRSTKEQRRGAGGRGEGGRQKGGLC